MYGQLASAALLGLSALAAARPTTRDAPPTSADAGFPNVSADQVVEIEQIAGGTLPNGTAPPTIQGDSIVSLGFVATNEIFEVRFFQSLIYNITNNVDGFTDIPNKDEVLNILKVHLADEELHFLNAEGAFNHFTNQTIQPCQYMFPSTDFPSAIGVASLFTDLVLGTLPDIQTIFGTDGDVGLIRGVGSVIGQEGEQNGFYRELLGKVPAQLPFLTGSTRDFALSGLLQTFTVPHSCPSLDLITVPAQGSPIQIFGTLNVLTKQSDFTDKEDITAQFSFDINSLAANQNLFQAPANGSSSAPSNHRRHGHGGGPVSAHRNWHYSRENVVELFVTYINQQNVPVSVPLQKPVLSGTVLNFEASFPGQTHFLNGLTIAAVTLGNGPFATPDDVAKATLFGPGLIDIN